MGSGIYTALSGAIANENRVELISHNLANITTNGFQQFRMALKSVQSSVPNDELTFAYPSEVVTDTTSGPIVATGNPLDVTLGKGVYMVVDDGRQEAFVRGGTMVIRPDGKLVTNEGLLVKGSKEEFVKIPSDVKSVEIAVDGTVMADGEEVDKIRLVGFENQDALVSKEGRKLRDPGGAKPIEVTSSQPVMAGYLEKANINAVRGMTDLIAAHRNYDATMKVVETFAAVEKRTARDMGK